MEPTECLVRSNVTANQKLKKKGIPGPAVNPQPNGNWAVTSKDRTAEYRCNSKDSGCASQFLDIFKANCSTAGSPKTIGLKANYYWPHAQQQQGDDRRTAVYADCNKLPIKDLRFASVEG